MAKTFEELMTDMVNIGFGVAATAVEKTQEALDGLSQKGEQVRHDKQAPDFARSVSDVFEQAGGMFSDVTERLSASGATAAERVLDELILARVRGMSPAERMAFVNHVRELADSVDDEAVTVEVESVEDASEGDDTQVEDAPAEQPAE